MRVLADLYMGTEARERNGTEQFTFVSEQFWDQLVELSVHGVHNGSQNSSGTVPQNCSQCERGNRLSNYLKRSRGPIGPLYQESMYIKLSKKIIYITNSCRSKTG